MITLFYGYWTQVIGLSAPTWLFKAKTYTVISEYYCTISCAIHSFWNTLYWRDGRPKTTKYIISIFNQTGHVQKGPDPCLWLRIAFLLIVFALTSNFRSELFHYNNMKRHVTIKRHISWTQTWRVGCEILLSFQAIPGKLGGNIWLLLIQTWCFEMTLIAQREDDLVKHTQEVTALR